MIILHFHLQPQYRYELFHINFTSLCILPSVKTGRQMLSNEVTETSRIANVRIYVEQAIKRLKECRIIKNELPVLLLPVIDCNCLCQFGKFVGSTMLLRLVSFP